MSGELAKMGSLGLMNEALFYNVMFQTRLMLNTVFVQKLLDFQNQNGHQNLQKLFLILIRRIAKIKIRISNAVNTVPKESMALLMAMIQQPTVEFDSNHQLQHPDDF